MRDDTSDPFIIGVNEHELLRFVGQLRDRGSLTVQVGDETFRVTITPLQISRAARRLLSEGGPPDDS
jgi:hypothetical protein